MSLSERQSELIDTHERIHKEGLPYVLVGGWAVSAFQTRFTTDIDIVVPENSLDEYDTLLPDMGYTKEFERDVAKVYEGRILRYTKPVGKNEVEFDALVGALRCRQTNAEWSYEYLEDYSTVEPLEVAEGLEARIPEPELLFALKIHSGRLADARDLVVVGSKTDFGQVERHLHRGDTDKLVRRIEEVLERFEDENFEDSFKGVFEQSNMPEADIDSVTEFLESQIGKL